MNITLTYNLPDELDIYKAALKAKNNPRFGVPMNQRIELALTKQEVELIDDLISTAINTCDDYLKDPQNTNKQLILDKLQETKDKYTNLSNYINFISNIRAN
jgi:hypothetical protein